MPIASKIISFQNWNGFFMVTMVLSFEESGSWDKRQSCWQLKTNLSFLWKLNTFHRYLKSVLQGAVALWFVMCYEQSLGNSLVKLGDSLSEIYFD